MDTDAVEYKTVNTRTEVVEVLAAQILKPLGEGKKVFWLVSGGSSIPVAAAASLLLSEHDTTNLFITLVDEKPDDPAQSNWQQLLDAGFDAGVAGMFCPMRTGLPLAEMGKQFDALLAERLDWADVSIGQFGVGADYHTGGIVPGSEAAMEETALAVGYQHEGVSKLTVTPALIRRLDIVFINSMGEGKREIVRHFRDSTADVATEPAQALKTAGHTVLYSDVL